MKRFDDNLFILNVNYQLKRYKKIFIDCKTLSIIVSLYFKYSFLALLNGYIVKNNNGYVSMRLKSTSTNIVEDSKLRFATTPFFPKYKFYIDLVVRYVTNAREYIYYPPKEFIKILQNELRTTKLAECLLKQKEYL